MKHNNTSATVKVLFIIYKLIINDVKQTSCIKYITKVPILYARQKLKL